MKNKENNTVMLNSFSCNDFRNVNMEDFRLSKYNILVGPNNAGKSNFIKAISIVSDMLTNHHAGKFDSAFLNMVSRNNWSHAHNDASDVSLPIRMRWNLDFNETPVTYDFEYKVSNSVKNCRIITESLSGKPQQGYDKGFNYFRRTNGSVDFSTAMNRRKKNKRLQYPLNAQETLLTQFENLLLNNKNLYDLDYIRCDIANFMNTLRDYFKGYQMFSISQFNSEAIRSSVDCRNTDVDLNSSASNFVNVYNNLCEDNAWAKEFLGHFKRAIHDIEAIMVKKQFNQITLGLKYDHKQYDLADVSEGTIKMLLLNMIINMHTDTNSSLLAIDEPEINLHPAWQKVAGEWLLCSTKFNQYFISTHSPDFLDTFTEEFKQGNVSILAFSQDSAPRCIRYQDIAEDLGDWELGDLYRTGDPAIGAWPW